jgi:hypothetical protein
MRKRLNRPRRADRDAGLLLDHLSIVWRANLAAVHQPVHLGHTPPNCIMNKE